jgi:hypothetical protein
MRPLLIFCLLVTSALAGDTQFNGRWIIPVPSRNRAWWLEVTGAGSPNLKGRFVGFPGGDMNDIPKIAIQKDELRFYFDYDSRIKPGTRIHQEYRARLVSGKLEGSLHSEEADLKWTGTRAPTINDRDDGSWHEGQPLDLFNGRDLSGWKGLDPAKELGWTIKDGAMSNVGGANNLISEQSFWNFKLHVEYRVGPHSNSGIGLRARYEVQILEDYGEPANVHGNGALYSRITPRVNASKPAGEWQSFDIRLVGRQVTVVLNDQKIIDKQEIEGLTAMASDGVEDQPGPLSLQGDHGPVEFRKILITPLVK